MYRQNIRLHKTEDSQQIKLSNIQCNLLDDEVSDIVFY